LEGLRNRWRVTRLASQIEAHAYHDPQQRPVVIFNASTRIRGLSLNAAFSLLTGWSLRLAGVRVINFICSAGMSLCVLGINREDYTQPPPCGACLNQSRTLYAGSEQCEFGYIQDGELTAHISGMDTEALSRLEYPPPLPGNHPRMPFGRLVLPSVRWTLRKYTLTDDEPTRYLLRQYILSAYHVGRAFADLLASEKPQTAVIFNGIMYPEASARWIAHRLGVRTVAHEVGFQRFSTFFTEGEPTAYPIRIPEDFELTTEQNARLDAYLEQRFEGKFSMAGIQFWPEMRGLEPDFLAKAEQFRQIVPIFTNVVYDTSQVHANVHFEHMFAWLDLLLKIIRKHPETLFVIRAHPDEMRPGTAKQSNESVREWVDRNDVRRIVNVVFIDSDEYISSYQLIQRAKFVIVYNSSIGMEAALMGAPVLCGGKARYTQYPIVFFPEGTEAYEEMVENFLMAEKIDTPPQFRRNARRFQYYQLYRASIPLGAYIQSATRVGFVNLRRFGWQALQPENAVPMQVLHDGILRAEPFLMPESWSESEK
jgi:hypothetical protein